jgi:hypothetical protein
MRNTLPRGMARAHADLIAKNQHFGLLFSNTNHMKFSMQPAKRF